MQKLYFAILLATTLALSGFPATAAESPETPSPVTTEDPTIPVDELVLLLKPLTKSQLLIEADA